MISNRNWVKEVSELTATNTAFPKLSTAPNLSIQHHIIILLIGSLWKPSFFKGQMKNIDNGAINHLFNPREAMNYETFCFTFVDKIISDSENGRINLPLIGFFLIRNVAYSSPSAVERIFFNYIKKNWNNNSSKSLLHNTEESINTLCEKIDPPLALEWLKSFITILSSIHKEEILLNCNRSLHNKLLPNVYSMNSIEIFEIMSPKMKIIFLKLFKDRRDLEQLIAKSSFQFAERFLAENFYVQRQNINDFDNRTAGTNLVAFIKSHKDFHDQSKVESLFNTLTQDNYSKCLHTTMDCEKCYHLNQSICQALAGVRNVSIIIHILKNSINLTNWIKTNKSEFFFQSEFAFIFAKKLEDLKKTIFRTK